MIDRRLIDRLMVVMWQAMSARKQNYPWVSQHWINLQWHRASSRRNYDLAILSNVMDHLINPQAVLSHLSNSNPNLEYSKYQCPIFGSALI
jgi:hypothetical protein